MGGGVWQEGVKQERAGFYMIWKARAMAAIGGGTRGVVAIPVRSNWGPVKQITTVTMGNLAEMFGQDQSSGFTAYRLAWLALLGKPSQLLLYRLTDGSESVNTFSIKDGANTEIATLESKYPTTRDFRVTIRESASDSTRTELIIYEGTVKLFSVTAPSGVGVTQALVEAVNTSASNKFVTAKFKAAGDGTVTPGTSQAFTGGNAGVETITSQSYIDAMTAFEAVKFNGFVLDTAGDSALRLTTKAWIERLRDAGKKVRLYMGGSAADDLVPTTGNSRSQAMNHEGIVNVTVTGVIGGVEYPSHQVAAWVAGNEEGMSLTQSSTYAITPFEDVKPRLTDIQIKEGIRAGSFILVSNGENVIVEKGINTLTSLGANQDNSFKKLKIIRLRDSIYEDIKETARKNWIGKIANSPEGQDAVLGGIKTYFQTMTPALMSSFTVSADAEKNATAEGDEFYWMYTADEVDNMERIYGTGLV